MSTATEADQSALKTDLATLPVVDLGGLQSGNPADKRAVARALGAAARTSGFFYITNHGVPEALMEQMFAASRAFHEKPLSFKMRYWSGFTTHHRAYVPLEENGTDFPGRINFNEALDMSFEARADHPDYLAGWRITVPNIWPGIPGWKDTVPTCYDAVFIRG